ncbi:ATP-binding protein [Methanobrevibacter sp. OttesenSCG-928-K11]|nr:ATP-binding protein [Methanobrevibacter sp. OttesenSCG-928-K11]
MSKIIVSNDTKELSKVIQFISEKIDNHPHVVLKSKIQLELAIEEAFVNVANYAYDNESSENYIKINITFENQPLKAIVQIIDKGLKYNPLKSAEPNISLDATDRPIGGLGIFLIKKNTDAISYFYKNNENVLTLEKVLE